MPININFDFLTVLSIVFLLSIIFFNFKTGTKYLWLACFGLLVWILNPVWKTQSNLKPDLTIIVDVSKSMQLPSQNSRLNRVIKNLSQVKAELSKNVNLTFLQVSDQFYFSSFEKLGFVQGNDNVSKINESLRSYLESHSASNILLFSDGNDVDSLANEVLNSQSRISVIGLGQRDQFKDYSLEKLEHSHLAFKGKRILIPFNLELKNTSASALTFYLKEVQNGKSQIVETQKINIDPSTSTVHLEFEFVPLKTGLRHYRIELPLQNNEITAINNQVDFYLDVRREKIKILYLTGRANPEYSFLRHLFKSEYSFDLTSFIILRNRENIISASDSELSLIPFPSEDLFNRALNGFDLVIFENFSYHRTSLKLEYLENLKNFVEKNGGAFLMIGGENSFGLGNYQNTPLDSILPVSINRNVEKIGDFPSIIKVLEKDHPIFNFQKSSFGSLFENQVFKSPLHQGVILKQGASLILSTDNKEPVLALWHYGQGKTAALMALETWSWAMQLAEQNKGLDLVRNFWGELVRCLVSEKQEQFMQIYFYPPVFYPKQEVRVQINLRENLDDFESYILKQKNIKQEINLTKISQLSYEGIFKLPEDKNLTFVAQGKRQGKIVKEICKLNINLSLNEFKNLNPNLDWLKNLAKQNQGDFYLLEDLNKDTWTHILKKLKVNQEDKEKKLIDSWFLIIFILVCLALHWLIKTRRLNQ